MTKKSGKAGNLVAPIAPKEAKEADVADPGKVEAIKAEELKTQSGKYGSVKVKPFKPANKDAASSDAQSASEEEEKKTAWIEVELVGEDKKPIPGERFRVTLPDGSVAEGTLSDKGTVRLEGFEPGSCKITFPDLDQDAWEDA